jgi:hypothetical protein
VTAAADGMPTATCSGGGVGAHPWTTTGARAPGGREESRPSSGGYMKILNSEKFQKHP